MTANAPQAERVLSTLNVDGTRRWLNPRLSKVRWLNRRRAVGYGLIVLFVTLPHLRIDGKPPLLIDILSREFTFFGTTLYPTDTLLLALMLITIALSVFFFTALFGRIWCGWGCPQTVYMELVFRPIERFFQGGPGSKKRFGPAGGLLKTIVFVVLSFALAHTFMSYFVGTDNLRQWIFGSPLDHPIAFVVIVAVTGAMLFDFGFFREQMCIVACPYGRFQSVMLDRDSLVVGYDRKRGEPRGKKLRRREKTEDVSLKVLASAEPEVGDCIDCSMCVQTCPTGIDIRDGLQMECVNCTQCIDACDAIMDKIGRPRGLIRYASQRNLDGEGRHWFRPRLIAYPTIIIALVTIMAVLLITREPALVTILRGPGTPFMVLDDGMVANTVKVKIHDRSEAGATYAISMEGVEGWRLDGTRTIQLEPGEMATEPVALVVPSESFRTTRLPVTILIESEGFEKRVEYVMRGPVSRSGDN
ncbi:MAG: cytochrome c oxidase accessory protein CcoG [Phycisphaerales bacterium]|nr:cytochrome c oxidase accessory protein CcoG [Phycisphaerales bacterium]